MRQMADTGYFLIADVLGFGRMVHNSPEAALDERIREWVNLVEAAASKFAVDKLQLISDTLFASVPSTIEGLAKLIDFSRELLTDGIEKSFPVRGAIVHGTFSWGRLTYGQAVIAAHELEQAQNWIGVACASGLPAISTLWSVDRLVCYPPPFKRAAIRLHPVVSWPVPSAARLMTLLMGGGLTREGEVINWNLGEKANNTILFRLYLDLLRANGVPPSQFYGTLPAHPIASALGVQ
jgi:hypothetical protein